MNRLIASLAVAAALVVGSAAAGGAATGRDFGAHVATCAQTVGFSADHDPGMHHGYAGWPGDTCTH
jgi:hypothetical protein